MKAELRERDRGERGRVRTLEELGLKMEEGTVNQEIQVFSGSWQKHRSEFSPSEEDSSASTLVLTQ